MSERTYHSIVDLTLGAGPIRIDPQSIQLDPDGAVNPHIEQALRLSMQLNQSTRSAETAALERFTAGNWQPIEMRFNNGNAHYDVLTPSLDYYHGPFHRAAWHRSMQGLNISLGAEVGAGDAIHPAHAHPMAPELALRYCGRNGTFTTITPEGLQTFPETSLLYYPEGIPHQDAFTGTEHFFLDWKIPAVAARIALPDVQPPATPVTHPVVDMLQGNSSGITRIHDALGGVSFIQIHQPESPINGYPGVLTLVYPFSNQEIPLNIGHTHLHTSFLQPLVSTGRTQIQAPNCDAASIMIPIDPTSPYAIKLLTL